MLLTNSERSQNEIDLGTEIVGYYLLTPINTLQQNATIRRRVTSLSSQMKRRVNSCKLPIAPGTEPSLKMIDTLLSPVRYVSISFIPLSTIRIMVFLLNAAIQKHVSWQAAEAKLTTVFNDDVVQVHLRRKLIRSVYY